MEMNEQLDVAENTDLEIWRKDEGSIFVTRSGGIGILCRGLAIVMPIERWHRLARNGLPLKSSNMSLARETAACAWCKPSTENKVMDVELAEAFAEILEEVWSKPWLGNATTGQLLDEIRARVNCDYKTVGEKSVSDPSTNCKPYAPIAMR